MEKKRIALLLEYDGTRYAGWQRQADFPTVQATVEDALSSLTAEKITLFGSSRTDAGVHARGHVSHFDSHITVPTDKIYLALGTKLPPDITVLDACEVSKDFHARFGTSGKQYSYYIWNAPQKSALLSRYSMHEGRPLDIHAMQAAGQFLEGQHDFQSFMAQGSSAKTTVRTLYHVQVCGQPGGLIRIIVSGNGFLYNMVRIIAGTLLYVGLGKLEVQKLPELLASGKREEAGKTLPANGLFLDEVYYPGSPFSKWYNKPNQLMNLLEVQDRSFYDSLER